MAKRLYVGGLPYSIDNDSLSGLFTEFGTVVSANVIMDRETGRSKGFGFVEMQSNESATSAIESMNGKDLGGRSITVNEARPMESRSNGGGGRGSW